MDKVARLEGLNVQPRWIISEDKMQYDRQKTSISVYERASEFVKRVKEVGKTSK